MKNQTLIIINEELKKAEETLVYYKKKKDKMGISYWNGVIDGLKEAKIFVDSRILT